ncbi:MAG: ribosomal protein S18-alanine N-acetyltransferase [Deferribacteraceae bacterium]|nr:ribosomal protein S18-alanine N-acetyltransferase [Deferribacteraceae bacterium]
MIRRAFIDDLDDIVRIEKRSFVKPWSAESLEAEFNRPFSKIFLFTQEERGELYITSKTLAYIIVWLLCPEGEIVSLAVDPLYRGRGIASALLRRLLTLFPNVYWALEVDISNTAALRVYEKCSFKKRRKIKNYYGQGRDAFLMTI